MITYQSINGSTPEESLLINTRISLNDNSGFNCRHNGMNQISFSHTSGSIEAQATKKLMNTGEKKIRKRSDR